MGAIRISGVTKSFGEFQALSSISLEVAQGEFVTLLGPSGCGKTTLLKIISGFIEPTDGQIEIGGENVTRLPPEQRDTALCFQSYALFPHLTVRENLEFGLRQKKLGRDEIASRVRDVSTKLELAAQMDKLPNQLSGGQQQRVSLGRALVMRPSVILFDEPLSNLDAKLRDQVRIEIRRIQKDYDLTAIYVTHDQAEALAMSDRVVVLNQGRAEQIDTPERLYAAPATSFVADFIGSANVMEGTVLSADGAGLCTVETPIGVLEAKDAGVPPGAIRRLSWRPEKAQIGEPGLTATVTHRAFQGHFTDLTVDTGGTLYRVQTGRDDIREGDGITFALRPADIVFLEAVG
ncbi:ABC transporter ATP-binding protein [Rhodobacteraceae bacterium CCMM004]|nr:ABC transporter ATP-binding protein [Rhodobacteraceae bacterium CCMM004]